MKELIHAHFDKIMLVLLFGMALAGTITLIVTAQSDVNVAWGRDLTSAIVGSLLTLITGVALTRKKEETPPVPPKSGA